MKNKFFKTSNTSILIITIIFIAIITQFSLATTSTLSTTAMDYYADLIIEINERGETTISGITNHPEILGIHQDLTSKRGKYWVFNLTSDEFSSALFKISLPGEAVITYIKSSAQISIGSDGAPFIKGILKNKPLEITIQYYFEESITKSSLPILIIIGVFLIIISSYYLIVKKKNHEDFKKLSLTPRQHEIFSLLKKKNNVTQKYLEKTLNLPKSSVSRNIASMERKGIITKVNKGNSNVILLNKNKK